MRTFKIFLNAWMKNKLFLDDEDKKKFCFCFQASDGDVIRGEYRVQLPDGRLQIVKYTADWKNGYNAEVSYQGQPTYPGGAGAGLFPSGSGSGQFPSGGGSQSPNAYIPPKF